MITINGKVYRNLQEQVYYNTQQCKDFNDRLDADEAELATKVDNVITSKGDLIVGDASGEPSRLAANSGSRKYLTEANGTPAWYDIYGTDVKSIGFTGVLTADGNGGASWEAVEGTDVISTGVTADKVLTADGNGGAAWLDIVPPEGDEIGSLGESAGKVLTSDGDDGAYWSTMEGNMIGSIGMTAGKVLKANGSGGAAWGDETPEGTDVKSTSETSGKVLTANGSGGASWQSVPQNFTGSVSGISLVISVGTNQLSSSVGSNGQFLTWNNGPVWSTVPQAEDEGV